MSFGERPLPGGVANAGGVVRVGDTVRRPRGPQTPAVQAYLAHLAGRGFAGAPRPHGFDEQGREVLSYVPGDVPVHDPPPAWCMTDDALRSVVALVRAMHDAAGGFVAPPDAVWAWPPPPAYRSLLVGHNDLCRENVVFAGGRATAFIDFDFAGPSTPVWELAAVVRHWVLGIPGDRVARVRVVREVYGGVDADALVQAVLDRLDWGLDLVRTRAGNGERGFVTMLREGAEERNRRLYAWVEANAADLRD